MEVTFNYGISVNIGYYSSLSAETGLTVLVKEKIGDRILFRNSMDLIYQGQSFHIMDQFFINSVIELWKYDKDKGVVKIDEVFFEPSGKKVRIDLNYENRFEGQNWVMISLEFAKKWDCSVTVGVKDEDLDKFRRIFPNLDFIPLKEESREFYASYKIGRFDLPEDRRFDVQDRLQFPGWKVWNWWRYTRSHTNPSDWRLLHSEDIAKEILGLNTKRKYKYSSIDADYFLHRQVSNLNDEGIE